MSTARRKTGRNGFDWTSAPARVRQRRLAAGLDTDDERVVLATAVLGDGPPRVNVDLDQAPFGQLGADVPWTPRSDTGTGSSRARGRRSTR